jgi:hypothetical protein
VKPLILGFSLVFIESNGLLWLALAVFGGSIWFKSPYMFESLLFIASDADGVMIDLLVVALSNLTFDFF